MPVSDSTIEQRSPTSARYRVVREILIIVAFAGLWCLPRLALFEDRVMMCDDYVLDAYANVYDVFFIREYRPLGGVYPMIGKTLVPGFFATSLPLLFNALFIGGICRLIYGFLRNLNNPPLPAAAWAFLFAWHPVINDFSAWNTVGFQIVACLFALTGFVAIWKARPLTWLLGVTLLTSSLLTYQLMIPIPACLVVLFTVHRLVVDRTWEWRRALSSIAALATSAALFLVYVKIWSPLLFPESESGSLRSSTGILDEWKGLVMQSINLHLNLYQTPLAHYFGISESLQLWYLVPVGFAVGGFLLLAAGVLTRRLRPTPSVLLWGCWIALPSIAILPLWLTNLYTDWRISLVVLLPQIIVLGSMTGVLSATFPSSPQPHRWSPTITAMTAIPVIVALCLVPVTWTDCEHRLADFRHDQAIAQSIEAFRDSLGPDADRHTVAYVDPGRPVLSLPPDTHALMKANTIINTYSTFAYNSQFAAAILRWHGFRLADEFVLEATQTPATEGTKSDIKKRHAPMPYVIHDRDRAASYIVGHPQWSPWIEASEANAEMAQQN